MCGRGCVCVCVCVCVCDREIDRETERERETERQRQKQRDRDRDTKTHCVCERERARERETGGVYEMREREREKSRAGVYVREAPTRRRTLDKPAKMDSLFRKLTLSVDGVFTGVVVQHLDTFAIPCVVITVLGDHVQLANFVLQ